MASIIQINGKWRALVRRKGHAPVCSTFPTKTKAQEWARGIEVEIDAGRHTNPRAGATTALGDLLAQYEREFTVGRTAANVIKHLQAGMGEVTLDKLTGQRICEYVIGRGYGPATATVELATLGRVLRVAKAVWGAPVRPEAMSDARASLKVAGRVGKSHERDRRPTEDEIDQLCDYFDRHSGLPMRDMIWFTIHTAMRLGEVTALLWSDLNREDKTIVIRDRKDPKRKKGNDQTVPLRDPALVIVERQSEYADRIFPVLGDTVSSIFPRACEALGIVDLRFHDFRHEGTSRLFELGYQIHEVAVFTGHRDWKMLRRYTQLRAARMRRL